MKHSWILLAGAVLCSLSPVAAEDSALGKHMEKMAQSFKAISKENDLAKGAALARDAQQATLSSLAECPQKIVAMPDGPEKAKALAEYRSMMARVLVTFCQMEEAFLAGKTEEVTHLSAELKKLRKAGHDRFMEEEE